MFFVIEIIGTDPQYTNYLVKSIHSTMEEAVTVASLLNNALNKSRVVTYSVSKQVSVCLK